MPTPQAGEFLFKNQTKRLEIAGEKLARCAEYPQIAGRLCKDLKFQQHILFLKDDEETQRITCVKMNLI